MINTAAKFELGLAFAAVLITVGIAAGVADPGAMALLLGVTGCIAITGVALAGSGFHDRAPIYVSPQDAPPLEMVSGGPSRAPRPSLWPLVAAVAGGLVALGLAVNSGLVIIGVVLAVLATAGWLAQVWREDPSFTPSEGARVSTRLLTPVGLPVMALCLIAVIVISVSRVLLTLPRAGSIIVAFCLALLTLVGFFALSARPNLKRNSLVALAGVAIVALVTAGSLSAAHGYRTFDTKPPPGPILEVAHNTAFQQKTITVTAGTLSRIEFKNLDRGTYHNVAVYGANGTTPIWAGEPIAGVRKIVYQTSFNLPPGKYVFRCNFHPTSMVGTFVVKAAS
ncbi:MAG TPA: hypothetical protein VHT30_04395 [Acidimicrobiales bacterium]|nr:hypothetical protein [Acidimicrobiales bacterium]